MSAFVIGIPAPEGLDSKVYRVRVVVDRLDGEDLTPEDVKRIEATYRATSTRTAKRRTRPAGAAAGREVKTSRKSTRAA